MIAFITHWGRYWYCAAPQGYAATGDGFSGRYDDIVTNIHNLTNCIKDALLLADTIESSFHQPVHWLDICVKKGITLNPDKFIFITYEVEFDGFLITKDSACPYDK